MPISLFFLACHEPEPVADFRKLLNPGNHQIDPRHVQVPLCWGATARRRFKENGQRRTMRRRKRTAREFPLNSSRYLTGFHGNHSVFAAEATHATARLRERVEEATDVSAHGRRSSTNMRILALGPQIRYQ